MDKKRRVVEGLKNLLIVALTCSALWLIGDSQVFQVSGMLNRNQHREGVATPGAVQTQRLLPVRMAVMSQSGCCGIQYDGVDLGVAFDRMAPLLNEALSGAQEPRTVTREEWERMLTSAPGMYFDFQGAIPLQVLSGWLSGQSNPNLMGSARHLLLGVQGEQEVVLAYRDEERGEYVACDAQLVNFSHLQSAVAQMQPNGAIFACQATNYHVLAPHTIVNAQTPQPREFAADNPLPAHEEDRVYELLNALAFPLGITTIYETPEGRRARSGNDTLTVSNDGLVTYNSTREEGRYPVTAGEGSDALFAAVDGAANLVHGVLDLWQGDARVYLERVEAQGQDSWRIEFRYALDNIPVQTGQKGCAASVLVDRGYITEFEFWLRTYTGLEQTTLILPQEQAAAALVELGQTGSQLQLYYQDSGDLARAGWTAGG